MFFSNNRNLFLQCLALAATIHNEAMIQALVEKEKDATLKSKMLGNVKDALNWFRQLEGSRLGDAARQFAAGVLSGIDKTEKNFLNDFPKKPFYERVCYLVNLGLKADSAFHESIKVDVLYETKSITQWLTSEASQANLMKHPTHPVQPVYKTTTDEKKVSLEAYETNKNLHQKVASLEAEKKQQEQARRQQEKEMRKLHQKLNKVSKKLNKLDNSPDVDVGLDNGNQQQLYLSASAKNKRANNGNVNAREMLTFAYGQAQENKQQLSDVADATIEHQQEIQKLKEKNKKLEEKLANQNKKSCCVIQ